MAELLRPALLEELQSVRPKANATIVVIGMVIGMVVTEDIPQTTKTRSQIEATIRMMPHLDEESQTVLAIDRGKDRDQGRQITTTFPTLLHVDERQIDPGHAKHTGRATSM